MTRRLIVIVGQEGAGKSTIIRALLQRTPNGGQIDAEDVGQVNPWTMDVRFLDLLWRNVGAVIENFWAAGYWNVLAGSFLDSRQELDRFRTLMVADAEWVVVQLCASKEVRDRRRIARNKRSSPEWLARVDAACPEDTTLASGDLWYRYLRVDNGDLSVDETVAEIATALPDIFPPPPSIS